MPVFPPQFSKAKLKKVSAAPKPAPKPAAASSYPHVCFCGLAPLVLIACGILCQLVFKASLLLGTFGPWSATPILMTAIVPADHSSAHYLHFKLTIVKSMHMPIIGFV